MNNQKQKSLICKNDPHMGMPCSGVENVKYYSSDSSIPALRLNNTFQQLLDNDIYLENSLNNLSSYIPGPKAYDEAAIEAGAEGYKVWGPEADTQLSILRKVDVPLEDTISSAALAG